MCSVTTVKRLSDAIKHNRQACKERNVKTYNIGIFFKMSFLSEVIQKDFSNWSTDGAHQ